MIRIGHASLISAILSLCPMLVAQDVPQNPADLKVELRSATGSNQFQLGEIIPLEVLISSSAPNKYLEPCKMFWESCFGYPQCRYETRWSFKVTPETGWTDIGFHGCSSMSGPTTDVKSLDLTTEARKYVYTLSNRFRFDAPGRYTVRLNLTFGLDDETNQIRIRDDLTIKHHSVSTASEIVLDIIPANEEWKKSVIERGVASWKVKAPAYSNPPSLELRTYLQDQAALCNLGTAEAAVALAQLLADGIDVSYCLRINAHKDVKLSEMSRLLVQPDVGVRPMFFAAYASLLSGNPNRGAESGGITRAVAEDLQERLFVSLSKKEPAARIESLQTVLVNPMGGYWVAVGTPYDSNDRYPNEVIEATAVDFDLLSEPIQTALLSTDWSHVRSPLMLPAVRRKAEAGNGPALLRWLELDPVTATVFIRDEMIRPAPRFSATYLRLPDESLPDQEHVIAANFIKQTAIDPLINSATLLHRYGTKATLLEVLPFIDQHLNAWHCDVRIPVLAYLLKVSESDAKPRLEEIIDQADPGYCPKGMFFPDLGALQPGALLDALAIKEIQERSPLGADAAEYLKTYGSPGMKQKMWKQLSIWHKKYVKSGAQDRVGVKGSREDWQLSDFAQRLREAYVRAQGWTLTPEDEKRLAGLLGEKLKEAQACTFSCGSPLSAGTGASTFHIYARINRPEYHANPRVDYLLPKEEFHYSINQYRCDSLKSLEEKLLQFPKGTTFMAAHTGLPENEVGDWGTIGGFLRSHGYVFKE